jgi:hypothetical protein
MGLVNVESDNPWARVWRQAITTGKPTGQWKGIGIRHQGVPFALGFLGLSRKTRRMSWFPAAHVSPAVFNLDEDGRLAHFVGRPVDHLTLDPEGAPGRFKSHLTYEDGSHGPTVSHFPRQGELVPWFSLLLHDLDEEHTRIVPEILTVTFSPPRSDSGYVAQIAGEGGWGFIDALPRPRESCFIQFDAWGGMTEGWKDHGYSCVPWVYAIGVVTPDRQEIQSKAFQADFAEDRGCVVVMSWVLGELDAPRLLRANRVTHAEGS